MCTEKDQAHEMEDSGPSRTDAPRTASDLREDREKAQELAGCQGERIGPCEVRLRAQEVTATRFDEDGGGWPGAGTP